MIDVVKGLVSSSDILNASSTTSEAQIDEFEVLGDDEERFPMWVRQSPDTIRKYIIEKKFSVAVNEVLQVRQFCEGCEQGPFENSDLCKVDKIRANVDELGIEMAHVLMQSIIDLPNSHIWGRN